MTVTTETLRELVGSCDAAELPPLSSVLVRCLELPAELPAELAISEVAEITGVSAHTLRYYERIGLVEVDRDAGGRRTYDSEALVWVIFVTRLRMSDMPIRDIARYLALVNQGEASVAARLALMQAHPERSNAASKTFRPPWPSSTTRSSPTAAIARPNQGNSAISRRSEVTGQPNNPAQRAECARSDRRKT
jgi:DNA-binding transcriptional MerR regulator